MHTTRGFAPILWVIIAAVLLGGGYAAYKEASRKASNSSPDDVVVSPTSPKEASTLSLTQVKNATYDFSPEGLGPVPFKNGMYQKTLNEGTPMEFGIAAKIIDDSAIALGDLNGDGKGDAAVFAYENSRGGNGWSTYLVAFLNVNGMPKQASKLYIDDRAQLKSLTVKDSKIFLSALVHTSTDGSCCPTDLKDSAYRLTNGKLEQVTTTDRTSWKTYRNEKYGFEFRYPKDFILSERQISDSEGNPVGRVELTSPDNSYEIGLSLLKVDTAVERLETQRSTLEKYKTTNHFKELTVGLFNGYQSQTRLYYSQKDGKDLVKSAVVYELLRKNNPSQWLRVDIVSLSDAVLPTAETYVVNILSTFRFTK